MFYLLNTIDNDLNIFHDKYKSSDTNYDLDFNKNVDPESI